MLPFVSVVIPTHTGGPYVREAIESVRGQTFDDWEIKVVCDGCDDDIADFRDDPRIEVLYIKRSGISIARNTGFSASSGQLITFFDHDDIMLPQKLEAQVAIFEADPTVGLCHTQFTVVDDVGNIVGSGQAANIQYEDMLQCKYSMFTTTALVRRRVVESVGGFDPKAGGADDIDFVLKVSRANKMAFIPEVLFYYRRHGQNTSGNPWTQYREVDYVLRGHRRYLEAIGDDYSVALIDQGLVNNRRANAEIAIMRARSSDRTTNAGMRSTAKYVAMAFRLSPAVVKENADAFFTKARG